MEFEVGSVVRLKSGGPRMTVTALNNGGLATCQWFEKFKPQSGEFPILALEAVELETARSFDMDEY